MESKAKISGIPLGWQIGMMIFIGVFVLTFAMLFYNSGTYQRLIMGEFKERIITLGENTSSLVSKSLYDLSRIKEQKNAPAIRNSIKTVLDSVTARKDIKFVIVKQNGKIISQSNSMNKQSVEIRDIKQVKSKFGNYQLYRAKTQDKEYSALVFPVEFNTPDMVLFMSGDVGEITFGFDTAGIDKKIADERNKSILIIFIGSNALCLLMMFFMYNHVIEPIKKISEISGRISKGEVENRTETTRIRILNNNDEIGQLTSNFEDMSLYLRKIADISERVSEGELAGNFEAMSEKDVLGVSFSKMLRYIKTVATDLGQISQGDLSSKDIALSERDVLGKACDDMTASLKNLIFNVKIRTQAISESAHRLNAITQDNRGSLKQLAEGISNISGVTADAAENSQEASRASITAKGASEAGAAKMKEVLATMQSVNAEIVRSTEHMDKLAGHSLEIKNMLNIIKSIAEETRLLSFNAAIEAARAGEAGLGFAVVAEEIRKLSDMSDAQTVKISERISAIRRDIALAIETVHNESAKIQQGSSMMEETNEIFGKITKSVEDFAVQMESVAAAAQEIAASSEESAASSEQQISAMEELNGMVEKFSDTAAYLKESTDKFKT